MLSNLAKKSGKPLSFILYPLSFGIPFTFFLLLSVLCPLTSGVSDAHASTTLTVAWDQNREADVVGYKVHYGTTSKNYQYTVDVQNNTSTTISGLSEGTTYYFAATAYNNENTESGLSEELRHTIPNPPPPPPPTVDTDGDGIIDNDEIEIYGTNPENSDTDGDGLIDGAEVTFWGDDWDADFDEDGIINLLDVDSDNDGYNDGTYPPPPSIPTSNSPAMETGEISLDHNWTRVTFKKAFTDPIVVAQPLSLNGTDPAVVRIRNVDSSGFDIRIQEWDYLDGSHSTESLSFLAMERGSYTLEDGTLIETGTFETSKVNSFGAVVFVQAFQATPVIISGIASFNESDAVSGRLRNINTDGFQYCMQEQELNSKVHQSETINYIAWEPSAGTFDDLHFEVGKTGDVVKHGFVTIQFGQIFQTPPLFLANMQTGDGMDTANVRRQNMDTSSVEVQIDEEQSKNSETSHTSEVVGYIALERLATSADSDGDGLEDNEEQSTYGSDPNKADTDGDGISDGDEVQHWGANWNLDYDGDLIINLLDPDSDGDGSSDGQEIESGTDPAVPNSAPENVKIWLEAESAYLNEPMEIAEDADTSGGEYIYIPNGNGNNFDLGTNVGYAVATFQIPVSGDYLFWGRIQSIDGGSNSFFVSIDNGEYGIWHTQISNNWIWDQVSSTNVADPVVIHLKAGEHTLIIKHREQMTKIDKILITNDMAYTPAGMGDDNVTLPPPVVDTDGDGLFDNDEINFYGTDPAQPDTDGDGLNDGDELSHWGDDWNTDFDGDGLVNLLDSDSDNDNYSDGQEMEYGFDPLDNNSNPGSVKIWFEAESGNLSAPMEISEDSESSSGKYISIPSGYGNNLDPNSETGFSEFTFQVPVAGEYLIWGRVHAIDGGSNSFFVSVDGSEFAVWHTEVSSSWIWDQLFFWGGVDPLIFYLEAGEHSLIVKQREPLTKIDKILITNDMEYIP